MVGRDRAKQLLFQVPRDELVAANAAKYQILTQVGTNSSAAGVTVRDELEGRVTAQGTI